MAGGANPQQVASATPFEQAAGAQTGAIVGTADAMQYAPSQVAATDASQYIGQYMNPYENQVVQQSLQDIGQAQQMGLNQLDAQASAAGAFGGSRHGVADAQTRLGYGKQATNMVGGLRQAGFNTALNAAQQQAQRGMTAQQLNQAAGLQGANLRLNAANQLGNLGRQSFGYGQSIQDRTAAQGKAQEDIMQQLINQAQGDFGNYTGSPQQGLATLLGAITGTPNLGGTNTSSNPGLFNYLQVLASLGG